MDLNRRKFQLAVASLTTGGLAGCINVSPDRIEEPSDGNSSSDDGGSTDNSDTDGEDDSPDPLTNTELITDSVGGVLSFSSWLHTDLKPARGEMLSDIADAQRLAQKLLSDVSREDYTEGNMVQLADHLRNAGEHGDVAREYYADAYHHDWYANSVEEDLTTALRREEYETLNSELDDISSFLYYHMSNRYKIESVPIYYPNGLGYLQFYDLDHTYEVNDDINPESIIDGIQWQHIYECLYSSEDVSHRFFACPGVMNIPYYPFGDGSDGWSDLPPDYVNPISFEDVKENNTELMDVVSSFDISDGRVAELYMNVHTYQLVDSNYPNQYLYRNLSDDRAYRDDLPAVDLNESNPIGVYIQKFADEASATTAFESIQETSQFSEDVTFYEDASNRVPITFEKRFVLPENIDSESETLYIHILQNNQYLIILNPSFTQWENRSRDMEDLFSQTWLNVYDPSGSN